MKEAIRISLTVILEYPGIESKFVKVRHKVDAELLGNLLIYSPGEIKQFLKKKLATLMQETIREHFPAGEPVKLTETGFSLANCPEAYVLYLSQVCSQILREVKSENPMDGV